MKECSQCGKQVEHYHRVFQGEGYCVTCYAREFKHKPCGKCGQMYRLPRRLKDVVCDTCRKQRPCARCNKTSFAIGKMTPYGPVCTSCAPYFREERVCGNCGKQSRRNARMGSKGAWLCSACYTAARGFATCPSCRRHRMLCNDGLCSKCSQGLITNCVECGLEIPAEKGKVCDECAWRCRLRKRTELLQVGIARGSIRDDFGRFAQWLAQDVGTGKAAMTIARYQPFFSDMAKQWPQIPGYDVVLSHFKPKTLRKYLKVKQWLQQQSDSLPDNDTVTYLAERDRIRVLRDKIAGNTVAVALFDGYCTKLIIKHQAGKTSLKSVRLALQPVIGLMQNLHRLPTQVDVDAYLKQKAGQRAALTGFINYLNHENGLNLSAGKAREKSLVQQKVASEKRILDYVIQCRENPESFSRSEWLKIALDYFQQQRLQAKYIVEEQPNGFVVVQKGQRLFVPKM